MNLKRKPTELERLLKTTDVKEQTERVRRLLQPTLVLAIYFDMRTGLIGLSNIGEPIPAQIAYRMLDGARQALLEQERKAAQEKQDAPPTDKPPTPQPPENAQG